MFLTVRVPGRCGVTAGIVAGVLALAGPVAAKAECDRSAEALTNFGIWYQPPITLSKTVRERTLQPDDPAVQGRYYRALIKVSPAGARDWHLTMRAPNLTVLSTLGPDDLAAGRDKLWTGRLPAPKVTLDLQLTDPGSATKITVEAAVVMPEGAPKPLYSRQDAADPQDKPLYTVEPKSVRKMGDSVAFLNVLGLSDGTSTPKSWCCSGVLVAQDLLMTNWHCGGHPPFPDKSYWNKLVCDTTVIDLSWDTDGISHEYGCVEPLVRSKAYDLAILKVAPSVGVGGAKGQVRLPAIAPGLPATNDGVLNLVHHGDCGRKRGTAQCDLVKRDHEGWVSGTGKIDFTHKCDSAGGSSGAPVFDNEGRLVGLHHLGFDFDKDSCQPTDSVNKAVSIRKILEFLKTEHCDIFKKISGKPDCS